MNLSKMMHIIDAAMRVENGKIIIDEPYAYRMMLPIFSEKIEYVIEHGQPDDSGVPFTAAVFVAETGNWYPLFQVNNAIMERIADYVDNYGSSGEGFNDRQMTLSEFNEIDGDFTVHLISLDDGTVPLMLDRNADDTWTLNNNEFELDIEDAPGLQRMIKKILAASPSDFYG